MSRDISSNNVLDVGDVAPIDITGTVLTVHAWVYPDSFSAHGNVVAKRASATTTFQYTMRVANGTGIIDVFIGDSAGIDQVSSGSAIGTGAWSAIGMRKNGTGVGALAVFRNGVLDGSATSNRIIQDTANILRFGARSDSASTEPFDGALAEIAIWDAALSDGEMAALAKGVSPRLFRPGNLKGYWPLWGSSSPERDYSGGGSHATLNGSPGLRGHMRVMPFILSDAAFSPSPITAKVDAATVYLDLQVSSVQVFEAVDAATVLVDLQTSAVEAVQRIDAATVYLNLQSLGGECHSQWSAEFLGEGEAWVEFYASVMVAEWSAEATPEWSPGSPEREGAHC